MEMGFSQRTWTPGRGRLQHHVLVGGVRRADRDDVHAEVQQFGHRVHGVRHIPGLGRGTGPVQVDVADPDDPDVVQGAEGLEVVAGDGAAADDADAEGAGGCGC